MKYLFYILLLFLIYSCENGTITNEDIISIDVNKAKTINLSDIIKDYYYIKLESPENIRIGEIFKIKVIKNKIYILDIQKAVTLFVFDINGKFLFQINKRGKGPGEFANPSDFLIDTISNNILIADSGQRKIIFYDSTGNYIQEIKTQFFFNSFYLYKNNLFFDLVNNSFKNKLNTLFVTDIKGTIISDFIHFDKKLAGLSITSVNPFTCIDDTLLFLPTLSNKIYSLSLTKVDIKYMLDFGKNWPTTEILDARNVRNQMFIIQKLNNSDYVSFLNWIVIDKIINFNYFLHGEQQVAFYFKENKKLIIANRFIDDIGCGGFSVPIGSYNNKFIGVIQIEDIKEQILDQLNDKKLSSRLLQIAENSKEGDNPVLLLTDLK